MTQQAMTKAEAIGHIQHRNRMVRQADRGNVIDPDGNGDGRGARSWLPGYTFRSSPQQQATVLQEATGSRTPVTPLSKAHFSDSGQIALDVQ